MAHLWLVHKSDGGWNISTGLRGSCGWISMIEHRSQVRSQSLVLFPLSPFSLLSCEVHEYGYNFLWLFSPHTTKEPPHDKGQWPPINELFRCGFLHACFSQTDLSVLNALHCVWPVTAVSAPTAGQLAEVKVLELMLKGFRSNCEWGLLSV